MEDGLLELLQSGEVQCIYVRETKEVERFAATTSLAASAFRTAPSELDQASLFRVQPQIELFQPLAQSNQARSRVGFMLKADHKVIRITDDDALAACMSRSSPVDPKIQDVMQKDIGKQR